MRETTSKDRFSARFIAYEASSHRTSPRGSSWVQALPGKFRGNHNPGFVRGNFCPFPGAYLGSHTPGIPGISGSTWEHTHPGAYPGIGTRVFPGGRWEPRNNPGQNLGKTRVLGLSRVFPGWCCWGLSPPSFLPQRPVPARVVGASMDYDYSFDSPRSPVSSKEEGRPQPVGHFIA